MSSRLGAVLLDLDGTLVDTVPLILASMRHAFEGRSRAPTEAEWIAGIGMALRVQLVAFTSGPADLETVVDRYRNHQRAHHDAMTRAYPGAVEAVRAIASRGHPVAVVTGKFRESAQRTLDFVGMGAFVSSIVGSDSCAGHKPAPEPVQLALRLVGREPGEAVFVGDAPVDVEAGNAAGVVTVAATWGACRRDALLAARPAHVLEDVRELPALVRLLL